MANRAQCIPFEVRSARILEYLDIHGTISVETAAQLCDISCSTARIQLGAMHEKKLLIRTHGGAIKLNTETASYSEDPPAIQNLAVKERLAAAASRLIHPGDTVVIAGGSTNLCLARALVNIPNIVVVTNSLQIAQVLLNCSNIELHISGGVIRSNRGSCSGARAETFFENISASISFIGVDSVNEKAGFTAMNPDERTECAASRSGKVRCAIFDHGKFSKGPYIDCLASLDDIDICITDTSSDERDIEMLRAHGIKVILA